MELLLLLGLALAVSGGGSRPSSPTVTTAPKTDAITTSGPPPGSDLGKQLGQFVGELIKYAADEFGDDDK